MDRQEIFDTVYEHMLNQSNRSGIVELGAHPQHRSTAVAAYRGTYRNMKCAIGCLIPDSVYHPNMEGTPIRRLINEWPRIDKLFRGATDEDVTFLEALQNVHDTILPVYWDVNLAMVANKFKVSHPNPAIMFREEVREPKKFVKKRQ